ncbi:MAG: threonine dehydratase [Candidatus Sumerlaeota bacterium]|nr:threonine dehydratase [Candidatus Sumerlaeota bacterium]
MVHDVPTLHERLFREIFLARQRVYAIGQPTPLQQLVLPSVDADIWVKREDLSPIHAYKWRGAYNRMAQLSAEERAHGVITASAGNHAQGVALAARNLGISARIVMPVSTPRMKQRAVRRHGGDNVEIVLHGDSFDDASALAREESERAGRIYIHAYDDWAVIGGQGTLADEIVMSGKGPFDTAYLQIGGGGMAAGVSCWLKSYFPDIHIVGVEGVDQASMAAAVAAGHPVTIDHADVFCDGTAIKRAGNITFGLCRDLIDEFITVTNEEVCAAIQHFWETNRCIPEPAGAMGLAGLLKQADAVRGKRALVVVCGGNMDFGRLAWIARHAGIGAARRRYFRFEISEDQGSMHRLLETVLEDINIIEFQYGKTDEHRAWPVIGFEASPPQLDLLVRRLQEFDVPHEDVTSQADVEFRIIKYEPDIFHHPWFIQYDFPERPGALHDFLASTTPHSNLCYFNYVFTGEEVGRALLGMEFASEDARAACIKSLSESGYHFREIGEEVLRRIL